MTTHPIIAVDAGTVWVRVLAGRVEVWTAHDVVAAFAKGRLGHVGGWT
jgi:hypothetical protein